MSVVRVHRVCRGRSSLYPLQSYPGRDARRIGRVVRRAAAGGVLDDTLGPGVAAAGVAQCQGLVVGRPPDKDRHEERGHLVVWHPPKV